MIGSATVPMLTEDSECQEASILSVSKYIPCGRPATKIVKSDDKFYLMCQSCAWHNVHNRRAEYAEGYSD